MDIDISNVRLKRLQFHCIYAEHELILLYYTLIQKNGEKESRCSIGSLQSIEQCRIGCTVFCPHNLLELGFTLSCSPFVDLVRFYTIVCLLAYLALSTACANKLTIFMWLSAKVQ